MEHSTIPWVEKYRPTKFDDIVLDPLNKQLFENCLDMNYVPNLLFYGPPGGGKCHTINTPILMYDGSVKYVQDVVVGDKIMGDDSTPRRVLSLGTGEDQLYDILVGDSFDNPRENISYGANSEHILCLQHTNGNNVEISVKDYLKLAEEEQNQLHSIHASIEFQELPTEIDPYTFGQQIWIDEEKGFCVKSIPNEYKLNSRLNRMKFLAGIFEKRGNIVHIHRWKDAEIPDPRRVASQHPEKLPSAVQMRPNLRKKEKTIFELKHLNEEFAIELLFIIRSLGFWIESFQGTSLTFSTKMMMRDLMDPADVNSFLSFATHSVGKIKVIPKGIGTYYGFCLDGNHRYVLGNFLVTHNTTTIINFINEYQSRYYKQNKSNVIHLNASDERGIDTIRNQIHQFVKSMNLFEAGLKFVILDEVDYMTKNAQQALKYILQSSHVNVRFALICNYITKIDEALKNEFICIRFNQLPREGIFQFIKSIAVAEKLNICDTTIRTIQDMYNFDVRSMINYIQLNQSNFLCPIMRPARTLGISNSPANETINKESVRMKSGPQVLLMGRKIVPKSPMDTIMNSGVLEQLDLYMGNSEYYTHSSKKERLLFLTEYIHRLSIQYNMDKRTIIQKYFNHIVRKSPERLSQKVLDMMETVLNRQEIPIDIVIKYIVSEMSSGLLPSNYIYSRKSTDDSSGFVIEKPIGNDNGDGDDSEESIVESVWDIDMENYIEVDEELFTHPERINDIQFPKDPVKK